jgi:hypothetical protein
MQSLAVWTTPHPNPLPARMLLILLKFPGVERELFEA